MSNTYFACRDLSVISKQNLNKAFTDHLWTWIWFVVVFGEKVRGIGGEWNDWFVFWYLVFFGFFFWNSNEKSKKIKFKTNKVQKNANLWILIWRLSSVKYKHPLHDIFLLSDPRFLIFLYKFWDSGRWIDGLLFGFFWNVFFFQQLFFN